jgi:hypothetical protein
MVISFSSLFFFFFFCIKVHMYFTFSHKLCFLCHSHKKTIQIFEQINEQTTKIQNTLKNKYI